MRRSRVRPIIIASALCAVAACTQRPSSSTDASHNGNGGQAFPATGSSGDNAWVNNGGDACAKLLTPDFVAQILRNPAGHSEQLSAKGCHFNGDSGTIGIVLIPGGVADFDATQKLRGGKTTPLTGVGDKAVVVTEGSIEAAKGQDRICDVDVQPASDQKLTGMALAQKLGEVCNKLFALP
ncbi:MAG: hypothetical protein ACREEB_10045 [Caulobacteraceae bacterium]